MQKPLWQHLAYVGSQLGCDWECKHRMKHHRCSAALCSHKAGVPSRSTDLQTTSTHVKCLYHHQHGMMRSEVWKLPVTATIMMRRSFLIQSKNLGTVLNLGELLKAQLKKPIHHFYKSLKISINVSHFLVHSKELETNLKIFKEDKQTGIHWFMADPLWSCQ